MYWVKLIGGSGKKNKSHVFSINLAYRKLRGRSEGVWSGMFCWFWKIKVLPSAHVTAWRVLENKIVTKANLLTREIVIESALCCLCGVKLKETNHMFFDCRIVWLVWNLCFKWLGIFSVTHGSYSHFLQFGMCNVSESVNLGMGSIWIVVVSEIWSHKKMILFKGGGLDYSEIFSLTQLKVWSWITYKFSYVCFSYSDWCLVPLDCLISL